MEIVKIPSERIAVLIGKDGETKNEIEGRGKVKLKIGKEGDVEINGQNSMDEWKAKEIIKALRAILPLKMEQISLGVTIPAAYSVRAYGSIKGFGTIKHEEWRPDGSWYGIVEMPAGTYAPFLDKLGEVTKGSGEAKIVR